jgi:hypothetical protein
MAALLAKLKAALAARGPPKINTGTSIAARVTVSLLAECGVLRVARQAQQPDANYCLSH